MSGSVILRPKCPHSDCGEGLLSAEFPIRNKPSVHLVIQKDGRKGDLYLSAYYDDSRYIEPEELNLLPGDMVKFFCPHCGKETPRYDRCYCKAPTIALALPGGGKARICTRKGCRCHSLEFALPGQLEAYMNEQRRKKKDG